MVNKSPSQHLHGRRCKFKMLNPSWERLEGLQWTCFHRKPDNASATCWFISGSSWELRYPFPKHFWKWFSFFEKWDMLYSFLEGTPSENILELGNCTNNCWTWFAQQTTRSQPQKPLLDKTYISVCHFATAAFWVPETRKFVLKKKNWICHNFREHIPHISTNFRFGNVKGTNLLQLLQLLVARQAFSLQLRQGFNHLVLDGSGCFGMGKKMGEDKHRWKWWLEVTNRCRTLSVGRNSWHYGMTIQLVVEPTHLKNTSQIRPIPQVGVENKKYLKPPPRHWLTD